MYRKITIIRGINVGKSNRMSMSDLITFFEELGFTNVSTYIQSGNVFFESATYLDNEILAVDLKNEFAKKFKFEVPVIVLDPIDIKRVIQENPFTNYPYEIDKSHVTFLSMKPQPTSIEKLKSKNYYPDQFEIKDKYIYIYCDGKYHESKISNNFIEKTLGVSATTRNWNTVMKLYENV